VSEAQPSLFESVRTSKKKREFASEVGGRSPSRSKNERIINKMGEAQSGEGEDKKISKLKECVRRRSILERREKYTHGLRARGVNLSVSFFLLIIGF
jgi:hypothetical protein